MRGLRFCILLSSSLVLLTVFITPTEALAVIQSLNGQTGQTQTFQNDPNVTISSSNNIHSLGWLGLLPLSRGGTGAGSFTAGSILFSNGSAISQDNSNLFWDDINNRLTTTGLLSKVSANTILDVASTQRTDDFVGVVNISSHSLDSQSGEGATLTIHSDNDIRYALSVYNDTASSTIPGYSFFVADDGNFWQNTSGQYRLNTAGEYHLNAAGFFVDNGKANFAQDVNIGQGTNSNLYVRNVNALPGNNIELHGENGGAGETGSGVELYGGDGGSGNTSGGNIVLYLGKGQAGTNGTIWVLNRATGGSLKLDSSQLISSTKTLTFPNALGTFGLLEASQTWSGSNKFEESSNSTIYVGSSVKSGCIALGDSDGAGITYITANDGVLSASSTKPSICQ